MPAYFEYQHLVTFADTNLVGNVYFANYVAWQGVCREHFLAQHAPAVADQLGRDLALVTVSCSCEFFSELYAMHKVAVRMSLTGTVANRLLMDFEYYRVDPGPAQLVARGSQTVACMTRSQGGLIPADIPDDLSVALASYAGGQSGGGSTRQHAFTSSR
jgi:enediyne core biosynthesis thioesterase